jgi:hypothetical protein
MKTMSTTEAIEYVIKKGRDATVATLDGEYELDMYADLLRCVVRGQQGGWQRSHIPLHEQWAVK